MPVPPPFPQNTARSSASLVPWRYIHLSLVTYVIPAIGLQDIRTTHHSNSGNRNMGLRV